MLTVTREGAENQPSRPIRIARCGGVVIDDAAIAEAGRLLARHAASPARVVLFGSRARKEGRPDSDLDFLVIEERVESKLDEMVRLRDVLAELDVPVDVVVVSREEAERNRLRPGSLVRRALAEGRVLVEP
ncbi:MAG: nucleotidyltransferase domain-containing protein [Thermoleophilaceae bacterium]